MGVAHVCQYFNMHEMHHSNMAEYIHATSHVHVINWPVPPAVLQRQKTLQRLEDVRAQMCSGMLMKCLRFVLSMDLHNL